MLVSRRYKDVQWCCVITGLSSVLRRQGVEKVLRGRLVLPVARMLLYITELSTTAGIMR